VPRHAGQLETITGVTGTVVERFSGREAHTVGGAAKFDPAVGADCPAEAEAQGVVAEICPVPVGQNLAHDHAIGMLADWPDPRSAG
jgi:hypothetical protein